MKSTAFALSLSLALVAPLHAQDTLPPDQEVTIDMSAGMVRYFRIVRPFSEINIGDAKVADVASIQMDRILITAKEIGQTDIMVSDKENTVLARVHVKVVPPQLYGRRTVTVRAFSRDRILSHTAFCERTLGMTADEPGPCFFEKTEPNLVGAPVISTGPVITTGNVANVPPAQ